MDWLDYHVDGDEISGNYSSDTCDAVLENSVDQVRWTMDSVVRIGIDRK